ncbi:hypothetical protein KIN20_031427 [Parelaphostrongylus tenuis]|uniref:PBC domain-containing protein n=1 Tax=Parelaphostrongylus tenuis TaxID=148309 RepID=A0AAD5R5J0_PARTN|nr:hypothetical protein KIN20_031427 [Parelaphostrongylus tenuis]
MEALLGRLRDAMNVSPTEAQSVYYEIANSKFRQALMEVFLERKEFIRAQLDPTLCEAQLPSHQINQMLRLLDNPVLPISPDEERDEETEKLERVYVKKMGELRNLLHSNLFELRQQGCEDIKADFCRILKSQQMLRPIDHQIVENGFFYMICHHICCVESTTSSFLIVFFRIRHLQRSSNTPRFVM